MAYNVANPAGGIFNKVEFVGCTIKGNKAPNGDAAGISLPALTSVMKDIVIRDCVIDGTYADDGNANGIEISNANRVNIENCIINGTDADGTGNGIDLLNITNSQVSGCKMSGNKSKGLTLRGSSDSIVIEDCSAARNDVGFDFAAGSAPTRSRIQNCEAVSNTSKGFDYNPGSTGVSFIGNKAQANGAGAADNFEISAGVINLQELSMATGAYSQITGSGAVLGSSNANIRIV